MIQKLFDNHVFMYIMLGLCACGVLLKVMLNIIYVKLIKASDNMGTANNKLTQMMKKKFETCYKLKIGVNNVDIFVDKYVYRYKFGGILLSTWENIGVQILMLCLLTGSVSSLLGLIYGCGKSEILSTFSMGILTSGMLILLEGFMNNGSKKEVIRLNMKDYLENFFKVRLEQEAFHPELIEQYKKELLIQAEGGQAFGGPARETGIKAGISPRAAKRLAKKQQKEALRMEKKNRVLEAREARNNRRTEKLQEKNRKSEEIKQRKLDEKALRERLKREAELALEKKREEERTRLELRKAEAKAQEERRKEEKRRQEEIKKALLLEKQSINEEKQKISAEHRTKAQEKKEILMKEIKERRMLHVDEQEVEKEKEVQEENVSFTQKENAEPLILKTEEIKQEEKAMDTVIPIVKEAAQKESKAPVKPSNRRKQKSADPMEDKLIEDILKEFLA